MARAIMRLYPGVKLAFGPTTANGFYYDVVVPGHNLSEDDFAAIEAEMARILKEAEPFERFSLPVDEARKFVADLGQTFKVEHIDEELHKYGVLSFYRQGEFVDLCRGPHIPHAGKVGAYKLLSVAGAYWKGRTDREVLQRVYGTAFFDKKELDAQLAQLEEAKKRDHRRLGRELNLYTISQLVGPGLILWMPKGAIVRGILESFIKEELVKRGYQPVYTPHIGKVELYQTSGHYPYYKDSQFPTLKMPAHPAAKELVDGLISGSLDDAAQRLLLGKAGMPEQMPRGRFARRGRSLRTTAALLRDEPLGARRLRRAELRDGRIPAQADELPAPHPDLCVAEAQLPRAAAAAGGIRHGLSIRAVGRALGVDPRARLHPGRRSSLLHSRAGARRVSLDDGDDPVLPGFLPGSFRLPRAALAQRPERPQVSRCGRATSGGGPRTIFARS